MKHVSSGGVIVRAMAALGVLVALVAAWPARETPEPGLDATAGAPDDATPPDGALDAVRVVGREARVIGWAVAASDGPVDVEFSAAGDAFAETTTGSAGEQRRLDVEVVHGRAAAAFDVRLTLPPGTHTLCADALAPRSGARVRLGCAVADETAAAAAQTGLQDLLVDLGRAGERQLDGVTVGLAVVPFDTGVTSGHRIDRLFISASSAKSWWTAAALANGKATDAASFAPAVFEHSSDLAAGSIMDLAGGIDAVNDFTTGAGMTDTAAIKWHKGIQRASNRYPHRLGNSNYTDPSDAVHFLYQLGTNQLLSPADTDLLAAWMRTSPRSAATGLRIGSTIPDSLPQRVRALVEHKSGWLEPGRYSVDAHLLDVGIVRPTNGSSPYAIALMAVGGDAPTYSRLIDFFQSASCQVYAHLADRQWRCPPW